ncbi:reverse transcriptase domain-containing protein [Tanacetum coccineum]
MITKQGIKANPEKVKAVIDMISPRTIPEVQSLNGKLAALGRFLAKYVKKALPFFKTLKGCIDRKDFLWNQEAESAFQELKLYLLAKWATKLGEHDIIYKPRSAVKGQVIANFIAECPNNTSSLQIKETSESFSESQDKTPIWTLYIDEASGSDGSRAGLILIVPDGKEIPYALRFDLPTSNNEAEYEALIAGLELALRLEVRHLQVFTDSLLISCSKNKHADALSKLASLSFAHLTKNVLVEVIIHKSIEVHATNTVEDARETWMTPIIEYLQDGRLPEDPNLARKIRIKAPQYSMKQGVSHLDNGRTRGMTEN